jgi:hypothetical protein
MYNGAPDTVIYDQVGTKSHNNELLLSCNVAYGSLTEAGIGNPMYATPGDVAVPSQPPTYSVPKPAIPGDVTVPSQSPTYSVPTPGGLREVDGYTVLRDASADSAVPPPSTGPTTANGGLREVDGYTILEDARSNAAPGPVAPQPYETAKHINVPTHTALRDDVIGNDSELAYAVPATTRSASKKDSRYNTLESAPPPLPPPNEYPEQRLATLPASGYSTLETEP